MFAVELTDPFAPDEFLERFDCSDDREAGIRVEEFSPLDADEVADLLDSGESVSWVNHETGVTVDAFAEAGAMGSSDGLRSVAPQ